MLLLLYLLPSCDTHPENINIKESLLRIYKICTKLKNLCFVFVCSYSYSFSVLLGLSTSLVVVLESLLNQLHCWCLQLIQQLLLLFLVFRPSCCYVL